MSKPLGRRETQSSSSYFAGIPEQHHYYPNYPPPAYNSNNNNNYHRLPPHSPSSNPERTRFRPPLTASSSSDSHNNHGLVPSPPWDASGSYETPSPPLIAINGRRQQQGVSPYDSGPYFPPPPVSYAYRYHPEVDPSSGGYQPLPPPPPHILQQQPQVHPAYQPDYWSPHNTHHHNAHYPPPRVIEYITQIEPEDVLSGRGGATNSHSGNKAFRRLVKEYQPKYLQAKKRDKPAVASMIVDLIRDKGGRFLQKRGTNPDGQILWIDIGDDRAREKTCQALREGAPELRRRRKGTSSDDEDAKPRASTTSSKTTDNSSPSDRVGVRSSSGGNHSDKDFGTPPSRHDDSEPSTSRNDDSLHSSLVEHGSNSNSSISHHVNNTTPNNSNINPNNNSNEKPSGMNEGGNIFIRPLLRLLPNRRVQPIPLDQLHEEERKLYLREFFSPPSPAIRKRCKPEQIIIGALRSSSRTATATTTSAASTAASPTELQA